MYIPLFVLVKAAHITTINAVLANLASGADQIIGAHTPVADPTTISHYALLDMNATQSKVDEFAAMTQGILPAINGEWGADGVPTGAEAVAAFTGGNMIVIPGYGITTNQEREDWIEAQRLGFEIAPYSPPGV